MENVLFESAVRGTLIVAGTAIVLWSFGIKAAAARHRAWTGVVILMLFLPLWTSVGPKLPLRVLSPVSVPAPAPIAPTPVSGWLPPVAEARQIARVESREIIARPRTVDWRLVLLGFYLLGVATLLARLVLGTIQARNLIRGASMQGGRLTSASCASPITVGWLKPVVILPKAWPQWSSAQLDAVLIHEHEHARRRDPLVQILALINRALFWFNPVAWWLERRLAALAEGACDTAVLAAGHAPQDYSEYLLDLARSTMREGSRVTVIGMAMPGRYLTQRIRQILDGIPMQRASRTQIAGTLAFCTLSSVMFAATTLAPRTVPSPAPRIEAIPAALTEQAAEKFVPVIIQPQAKVLPWNGLNLEANSAAAPAPPQVDSTSQNPPAPKPADALPVLALLQVSNGFGAADGAQGLGQNLWSANVRNVVVQTDSLTPTTPRWPNTARLGELGLTDDQRLSIQRTIASHSQNIAASRDQLQKEEAQLARLLAADPIDPGAILVQSDRVIQARGDVERANGAMTLDVREYLSQSQWIQWQSSPRRTLSIGSTFR